MLNIVNGWTYVVKQLQAMILTGEGLTPAAAIPNAGAGTEVATINAILAVLRTRGLIATA